MPSNEIQTYRGKLVSPFNFRANDFDVEDVAHALSHQGRYSGHTTKLYTVAEHCVRVLWGVQALGGTVLEQRWALLHDSSEAYLLDLPSPIKNHPTFKEAYLSVERPIQRTIAGIHDLPEDLPSLVKEVDNGLVAHEATALFFFLHPEWKPDPGRVPIPVGNLGWKPSDAKDSFLWHYRRLFR